MNNNSDYKKKIGGAHTTIIGGRPGRKVIGIIMKHKDVKKVIPSVIKTKQGTPGGFNAKILRPDDRGNLRLLIIEGTSFQEIRIVTKFSTAEEGILFSEEMNEIISKMIK
ncbi:MAG: DUF2103 domain-containing protein [Methanosarcinaceae archaeon]|nr:DUF2103 domain-containing protein [Methanosarcinaceae archaeon]